MNLWHFTRGPASARLLLDFGVESGLVPAQLLRGTGLSMARLSEPGLAIRPEQELSLIGNLLRLLRQPPSLGLELGSRYRFSTYGVWGFGLVTSATLGEAVARGLRFLPLSYAFTEIAFQQRPRRCALTFTLPDFENVALGDFVVERDMVAAAMLLQDLVGAGTLPLRCLLRVPRTRVEPATVARLSARFGIEFQFGAAENALVIEEQLLQFKLPHANPITAEWCERDCQALLQSHGVQGSTALQVRHYLQPIPGRLPPSLTEMAELLGLSPRTLKRRLHAEGLTYRSLLDEARSRLAKTLLAEQGLSVSRIASQLGFSDLSSFSQSFKRWQGVSPRHYRQGLAKDAATAWAPLQGDQLEE